MVSQKLLLLNMKDKKYVIKRLQFLTSSCIKSDINERVDPYQLHLYAYSEVMLTKVCPRLINFLI